MTYTICGCIQGTGMDADKFFDVCTSYEADDIDAAAAKAAAKAAADGIWVEKVMLQKIASRFDAYEDEYYD